MSLKDRVKRAVGSEDVTINVPPADPLAQVVTATNNWGGQVKALYDERNNYKQWAERLQVELETIHRQLHLVAQERDNWRRIACNQIASNGKLKSSLDNIESIFHNIRNTSLEVDHLASQLPPEPAAQDGNGEDAPVDLDAAFESAPEPTREEVDNLRITLAKLPQQ